MKATISRKRPRLATKEENADEYLNTDTRYAYQARTDYAIALLNPFKLMTVRIPDLSCYPTAVYTQQRNFNWVITPVGNTTNNQVLVVYFGGNGNTFYQFYQGDGNNPSFGNATNNTWEPSILDTSLNFRCRSSRLVSAGVRIKFSGNDSNNQGTMSIAPVPAALAKPTQDLGDNMWKTADMGALNQVPGALLAPITSGGVYRYQPQDADSFRMVTTSSTAGTLLTSDPFGAVIIALSGVASNSTFIVEIAATYEGIQADINTGIDSAKGPADPVAQAFGMDIAGRSSNVFTVDTERMNIEAPIRQVLKGY